MRKIILTVLSLLAPSALAADAASDVALEVAHAPPAEAQVGRALAITAAVEADWKLESLTAHWRLPGKGWEETPFGKGPDGGYVATIPAPTVQPPRLEYFVTVKERGQPERDVFANSDMPHPVLVRASDEEMERQGRLALHRNHSSRARLAGEYVVFGSVRGLKDQYYQAEAEYLYRILGAISHIRLGFSRIRGDVPSPDVFAGSGAVSAGGRETGVDYGFAELAVHLGENGGLYGKVMLGADDLGFVTGVGGMVRIGPETATRVEIGAQGIQHVGFDSFMRLAWDTVPRWPMAFTVHITDTPAAPVALDKSVGRGAPQGIRAVYDVGFQATSNLTLMLRGGYQARVATAGGTTFGGGVMVEW